MRLYTGLAALTIVFGGCTAETEPSSEALVTHQTAATKELETHADATPGKHTAGSTFSMKSAVLPVDIPEVSVVDATSTATEAIESSSTIETVGATEASVQLQPVIVSQPSLYPVEMARLVELREQLQQIPTDAGALSDQQATQLERFAAHMYNVAQSDRQLTNDQRKDLEDLAAKVQHQAAAMREGRSDSTFQNRLNGVKLLMESMQDTIASPVEAAPQ